MKLYALSIMAQKESGTKFQIHGGAGYSVASSKDEALGKALRLARQEFPQNMGWFNHQAMVCEIDEDTIKLIAHQK